MPQITRKDQRLMNFNSGDFRCFIIG